MRGIVSKHPFRSSGLGQFVNRLKEIQNHKVHKVIWFIPLPSLLAFHFSISEGLGLGAGFLSHTTQLSAVEQERSCLSDLPAGAVTPVSSISIPVKGGEICTLQGTALWKVFSSTEAVLGDREKTQWGVGSRHQQALNLWIRIFSLFLESLVCSYLALFACP